MKRRNLKILLILSLFIGFSSCGSDNETGTDSNVITQPVTPLDPTDLNNGTLASLRAFVANMSFNEDTHYYYTEFYYTKRVTKRRGNFTHWISTNMYRSKLLRYDNTYTIRHEFGSTLERVRDGLLQIIDQTVTHKQVDQCLWELTTSQHDNYSIDVCRSIVANPVVKYSMGNIYPKTEYKILY